MKKLSALIGMHLRIKKLTLSVCESCTGGMLGSIITRTPGSSTYFVGGIIAYSNDAKRKLVGVRGTTLVKYGAVSAQVAREMANRVCSIMGSDIGIGITGIAGPTGGSRKKPVGLVYISIAHKRKNITKRFMFKGNRTHIRKKACEETLLLLHQTL
jgi:PncC family amidohydrolase